MSHRSIRIWLAVLCVIALVGRLGADIKLKAWRAPSAMEHRSIAMSLVAGTGFSFSNFGYYGPSSVQSPLFPFLLAGMYKTFHAVDFDADHRPHLIPDREQKAYLTIMVMNALAGALLVWLTYLMTRTLGGTPLAGLIAGGLVAVWPTQIYAARFVQAVVFITCGLAAMIILYHRAITSGKTAPWVGYSLVAALVAVTEPVFLPGLVLITGLMLISRALPFEKRVRNLAIQGFAVLAIIGPWATRNYIVHGKLIPVKGSFWVNVWKGNNDYATGSDRLALTKAEKASIAKHPKTDDDDNVDDGHHLYDMLDPSQTAELANHPEAYTEEIFKRYATTWIKAHPGRFVQLCGIRFVKSITIDWDNPPRVPEPNLSGQPRADPAADPRRPGRRMAATVAPAVAGHPHGDRTCQLHADGDRRAFRVSVRTDPAGTGGWFHRSDAARSGPGAKIHRKGIRTDRSTGANHGPHNVPMTRSSGPCVRSSELHNLQLINFRSPSHRSESPFTGRRPVPQIKWIHPLYHPPLPSTLRCALKPGVSKPWRSAPRKAFENLAVDFQIAKSTPSPRDLAHH